MKRMQKLDNGRNEKEMMKKATMKKKNMKRLGGAGGGGGLSLEAFCGAKAPTKHHQHNPALLKKKREFYQNAKHVTKYKKQQKQDSDRNHLSPSAGEPENQHESGDSAKMDRKRKKVSSSLEELYLKKCEEKEKARSEREVMMKAKKEEQERAEARRKERRKEMFKKTRKGQPVMKYRIEHLLETIQKEMF